MQTNLLKNLLKDIKDKKISVKKGISILKDLPYIDLNFAKLDMHRSLRRGFPEVVLAQSKTSAQIEKIAQTLLAKNGTVFITRANQKIFDRLKKLHPDLRYHPLARIIYCKRRKVARKKGTILIITAGTADIPVAEEARLTLEVMGCRVKTLYDVGVAGLHRILDKRKILDRASVIIVIAGMEGALASVVSGITSKPIVAVPTSVGYGASFKGIAPLLTMLNACSPGIGVVNIDNGFGAAYLASLINGR